MATRAASAVSRVSATLREPRAIWKAWEPSITLYYPAKVIRLVRNDDDDDALFPVKYTIQFLVDEDYNECSNGDIQTHELDVDMNEWADEQPEESKAAELAAKKRRNTASGSRSKRARRSR